MGTTMTPMTPEPRPGTSAVVFAKSQPQYRQLPANAGGGYVETKWKLTIKERFVLFFYGRLYLTVKTFDQPLQPIRMSVLRGDTI